MQENKSIGPFKTMGTVLHTVGTAAVAVDRTIETTGEVLHEGLKGIHTVMAGASTALEIVTQGALEDLKTDNIIDSAHRKVRAVTAKLEAKKILDKLKEDIK